jgi:hypothetical protein
VTRAVLPRTRQLLDDTWSTMSMGISRLTVAASNVASATVATVKPGLQARAARRCQRGTAAPLSALRRRVRRRYRSATSAASLWSLLPH